MWERRTPNWELNELPLEAETVEMGYRLCEPNGRPNTCRMPTSSADSASSPRRSCHSGKLQPPFHVNSDSNGTVMPSGY
ncbi:hypothetical protein K1719_046609 [Acacia pycnantha]|nr:hypothetical protein K1719_046609 [Acacia pycnantha]